MSDTIWRKLNRCVYHRSRRFLIRLTRDVFYRNVIEIIITIRIFSEYYSRRVYRLLCSTPAVPSFLFPPAHFDNFHAPFLTWYLPRVYFRVLLIKKCMRYRLFYTSCAAVCLGSIRNHINHRSMISEGRIRNSENCRGGLS